MLDALILIVNNIMWLTVVMRLFERSMKLKVTEKVRAYNEGWNTAVCSYMTEEMRDVYRFRYPDDPIQKPQV
jgi:hypothetical protein